MAVTTNSAGTANTEIVVSGVTDLVINGPINVGEPIAIDSSGRGVRFTPESFEIETGNDFGLYQGMVHYIGYALQSNTSGESTIRVMVEPFSSIYVAGLQEI